MPVTILRAQKPPQIIDPIKFKRQCWPHIQFYKQQVDIIYSVRDNDNTVVPAGNGLGKDFVSAFIALWWMSSRRPARCVTTSVSFDQLDEVLWGEIRQFIETSRVKLPLQYNHMKIRQIRDDGRFVPKGELVGQCISKGESLLGRHLPKDIPRTLVIYDEASGIDTKVYTSASTWAHHSLTIGNPFPCENFFKTAVVQGDIKSPTGEHFKQKVIHIKAEDSPNVRRAFAEIRAGTREPTPLLIKNEKQHWGIYGPDEFKHLSERWQAAGKKSPPPKTLIPGLIGYTDYVDRRTLWDNIIQCISIDGEFYEGAEILMFPPQALNAAMRRAVELEGKSRKAKSMGVDSAQGGDNTAWAISDELGLLYLESMKTPNTTEIPRRTIALMKEYGILPENVLFDIGGGGKQHVDLLREKGYNVRGIAFGESVVPPKKWRGAVTPLEKRKAESEERYAFKNRRAEMYALLMMLLNPVSDKPVFALPERLLLKQRLDGGATLRKQLAHIPLWYDDEGRLYLPPKQRRSDDKNGAEKTTLMKLIGCSPDEADATVLSVYGLVPKTSTFVVKSAA